MVERKTKKKGRLASALILAVPTHPHGHYLGAPPEARFLTVIPSPVFTPRLQHTDLGENRRETFVESPYFHTFFEKDSSSGLLRRPIDLPIFIFLFYLMALQIVVQSKM